MHGCDCSDQEAGVHYYVGVCYSGEDGCREPTSRFTRATESRVLMVPHGVPGKEVTDQTSM